MKKKKLQDNSIFIYKINFDDLVKYLRVIIFDRHLASSMIVHEYYQTLAKINMKKLDFYL